MTDEQLAFSIEALQKHGIVDSGDALTMGIGAMEGGQWVNFVKNTVGWFGSGKPPFDRMYSLQFVNQGHGLALKEVLIGEQQDGADLPTE
jgi:NitT/TauT family transport system substrate-binding protein